MKNKTKIFGGLVLGLFVIFGSYLLLKGLNFAVINPAGQIAQKQKNLILFTLALSLIVVIPVFVMTFAFAWKYRASNKKSKYMPEWDSNKKLEFVWWAIPIAIIFVLSVITWRTSHSLDPYKQLESTTKPLTVQVVALDWKWLFIYPEQSVASVNELNIPTNTPINFEITADAPMNSFWIPQLGGQIYAMAGMQTKLHLIADKPGIYSGSSANLSGNGFSGMDFKTKATSKEDFELWVKQANNTASDLGWPEYQKLAEPTINNPVTIYSLKDKSLYNEIIMKYMNPTFTGSNNMVKHKDINEIHNHGAE